MTVAQFLTQTLYGLGCLIGMIVLSVIAIIIGNGKRER